MPCSPRTRRCAGSPTSPGCRRRPAACSSAEARRATSARSSPPAGGGGRALRGSTTARAACCWRRAGRTRRSSRRRGRWTPTSPRSPPTAAVASAVRPCGPRSRDSTMPIGSGCSPSSPRAARRTPGSSTTSRPSPSWPASWARGSTSTVPTAAAALAAPSVRRRFDGIEAADSFIVDPHKWLFAPFDSCALLYRDPEIGRLAHTQHAEYLEILHGPGDEYEWNASDYAHHLTRRAAWAAAVVQLGDPRHAGLHRCHRDHAARHPRGRRAGAVVGAPRADRRTGAVRRAVPPARVGTRSTTGRGAIASSLPSTPSSRRRSGMPRRCCAGASSTR